MMADFNYQYIEDLLLRLLGLLLGIFSDAERSEVQEFIEIGEYGLALETLVDVVVEEEKQVPRECLELVCELAGVMKLDDKVFEEKLRGHITDN